MTAERHEQIMIALRAIAGRVEDLSEQVEGLLAEIDDVRSVAARVESRLDEMA